MKTLALLLAVATVALGQDECAPFGDWPDFDPRCLWFPPADLRRDALDACDIDVAESLINRPSPFDNITFPERCGHCSPRVRCRKRSPSDGCFPVEVEMQHCHEHGDICELPKIEHYNIGCKFDAIHVHAQQCLARSDLPDWKREGYRKLSAMAPHMNCKDTGTTCKCCCEPYAPNEDGSACVEHTEPQCEDWGTWNDWSEKCLWFPPQDLKKDFVEHCQFNYASDKRKEEEVYNKLKLPEGYDLPERCGYCSFQIKCRKRPATDADGNKKCFPLDAQKKACGESDSCPTCHTPCALPKLLGSCDYTSHMQRMLGPGLERKMNSLPIHARHGLVKMMGLFPMAKCVEDAAGQCKCCCHPYTPNADGSACVVNEMCTVDESAINLNVGE